MIPILIPAYRPDNKLLTLVIQLINLGCNRIVIVLDGEYDKHHRLIQQFNKYPGCLVLIHAINLGKGRALKTGLNHILTTFTDIRGVVTADADGQHLPEDILHISKKLEQVKQTLILGTRSFDKKDIPFRSKFGNNITQLFFRFLTGKKLTDTQTGLRGIPVEYIPHCLKIPGEKYEYEIGVLLSASTHEMAIAQVPIETVYIEQNRSSHFNPLLDSARIYFVLFRFIISAILTITLDFIIFSLCLFFNFKLSVCILISRAVAGNLNYFLNKKVVFFSKEKNITSFFMYWTLVGIFGCIAYWGIYYLTTVFFLSTILSKLLIEGLLFLASFTIQRDFIFANNSIKD